MVEPTPEELESISAACSKLWDLDENRLVEGRDFHLNLQGGKRIFDKGDMAAEKLFGGISDEVWQKRTYLIFYHLLDNYERATGVREHLTERESQEAKDFLKACMETQPMRYCFKYLVAKGIVEDSEPHFLSMLHRAWFQFYRRDGEGDSSGFEHVFVGELDEGHVKGLHNWIQTMVEEKRGNLEYMGFVLPRRRGADDDGDGTRECMSIQLGWQGEVKDVSTMFVGTSPEFELALYSLCFFAGEEVNRIVVGDCALDIKCYKMRDQVGTCFPVTLD